MNENAVNPTEDGHVLLENEDEFEEFETEDWGTQSGANIQEEELWEQDWDDDSLGNDDFSQKLKQELGRNME
jgi:26 proteasome complex subunit DSS1